MRIGRWVGWTHSTSSPVNPQPSDGFEWVQASAGPALRCATLEPLADHLFTTRAWRLGRPAHGGDDEWTEVAAAMDVEPARLARVHQVHGAAVVVAGSASSANRPR